MPKRTYQSPRGTKDILPKDQPYWNKVRTVAEKTLSGIGFERIDTPTFENIEIFNQFISGSTDDPSKEIYHVQPFDNKEEQSTLALRPEGTAGVARSYIQNGMSSWAQPVRLYYFETIFRHEQQQKGNHREYTQLGVEIFGDESAKSDYLAIMSAWEILTKIGLKDLKVYANSIGCPICKPKYILKLRKYYKEKISSLCADCQSLYEKTPLRLFDCKNEKCQAINKNAPTILDSLCKSCRDHFQNTLGYLDYFDIKYDLDPKLVPGIDCYSNTVFEIASKEDKSRQNVIGGGGRHNGLVELLGGPKTPAVGYGLKVERIIAMMKEQKVEPCSLRGVQICILQLGEKAKTVSKKIYDALSNNDINVYFVPSDEGLRQQISLATKLGAKYAVIIGQREAFKDEIILRDLEASSQEVFPTSGLVDEIKRRFEKFKCK